MSKLKYIFGFLLLPLVLEAQTKTNNFFQKSGRGNKYFIAAGVGIGSARWNSLFQNTEFYDKDGSVINRGDFHFGAKSPTRSYDVNVQAPLKKIRLGLGICFEHHYLAELKVYDRDGSEYLLFDEGLRFDKIYFNSEIPLKYASRKKYSINLNFRTGWFGYTNVKRFNFIGEKPFPIAILAATGVTVDYELFQPVYAFIHPSFEYKLYDNSRTEAPVQIVHQVFHFALLAGIRVDLKMIPH